jgi:hypothetical protein
MPHTHRQEEKRRIRGVFGDRCLCPKRHKHFYLADQTMPRSSLSTAFLVGKSLVDVCPASNSQKIQNQLFTDGSHFQGSPTRRPIKMIAGLGWGLDAWFRYDWAEEVQRLVRKQVEGLYYLDILRADYVSEEGRLFTHTLVKNRFYDGSRMGVYFINKPIRLHPGSARKSRVFRGSGHQFGTI